jgi:outer membrane lipoprotein-sorting protein
VILPPDRFPLMKNPLRFLAVLSLCWLSSLALRAAPDVDQVIARARAEVGREADLAALKSLHYTGTLTTSAVDEKGELTPIKVGIEIIFQAPYRQRIVATSDKKIEITALDDYEGWQREQDPADSSRWRMTLLAPEQIKRLRANTWENLSFFKGIEARRGHVEDLGMTEIDGKTCRKLSFQHDDGIVFTRYFDTATGRLVLTETENGISIREEGEIMEGGLRFPRKIISSNKLKNGADRVVTITFDKITVNETFADSLFAVPAMGH